MIYYYKSEILIICPRFRQIRTSMRSTHQPHAIDDSNSEDWWPSWLGLLELAASRVLHQHVCRAWEADLVCVMISDSPDSEEAERRARAHNDLDEDLSAKKAQALLIPSGHLVLGHAARTPFWRG